MHKLGPLRIISLLRLVLGHYFRHRSGHQPPDRPDDTSRWPGNTHSAMQLNGRDYFVEPGPRHGAPFSCSVTRPYEITHPSRAFRAVLDRPLLLFRAMGRGPSRARRTRMIHSVRKQRSRSPCAGPKYVLMTPMHERHCCPTCEGSSARVYGYAWCLIDPLHSALEKGVTDLLYGVVLTKFSMYHGTG
eukprot:SAG11_NODE_679_length_7786_cov_6.173670_1_plen_188_part_00